MDERAVEEQLVRKVGGKFRLSSLIQKRMQELKKGAAPMVPYEGGDLQTLVMREIMEDKIDIKESEEEPSEE